MKLKIQKPSNPHNRVRPLRCRVSLAEFSAIKAKANAYCEGSLSDWIRLAAISFNPDTHPDTPTEIDTLPTAKKRKGSAS